MDKTKTINFRQFLASAKGNSDAYVSYDIHPTWNNLKIADCHRSISLDFTPSKYNIKKYKKFKKIMLTFFEKMDVVLGLEEEDVG